jgi:beta-N-acetylhexosaminidase
VRELAAFGFTVALGPVVDILDAENQAIGVLGRAFGSDADTINAYAAGFIDGFASAGLFCAAKHFPGQGHSAADSHDGEADILARWTEADLEPFARLIAAGRVPIVMSGHLRLDAVGPGGLPATLSAPIITGLLREGLGFRGVVMTDDIDMGAVSGLMSRGEAVVAAIAAGNDLLMIKNLFGYDPLLPDHAVRWVRRAIRAGRLREEEVIASAMRVRGCRLGR